MKEDLETLLVGLKQTYIDFLNIEILAINADKNDDVVMLPIDTGAFFLQGLNDVAINYDPFFVCSLETSSGKSNGPSVLFEVEISCSIIMQSQTGINENAIKLFRYNLALLKVLQRRWFLKVGRRKLELNTIHPFAFKDADTSLEFLGTGIILSTVITL
jgi:hypothetical protein